MRAARLSVCGLGGALVLLHRLYACGLSSALVPMRAPLVLPICAGTLTSEFHSRLAGYSLQQRERPSL